MTFNSYIQSLPSIETDYDFWKYCGPCTQGESKVPYFECGECNHLNLGLVEQYIVKEEELWKDIDLEVTDYTETTFSDKYVLLDGLFYDS